MAHNKERKFLLASGAHDDIFSLWVGEGKDLLVYFKRIDLIAMRMDVRANTCGQ